MTGVGSSHESVTECGWQSRRTCMLTGSRTAPAAIREVSARGAALVTDDRPILGSAVELSHPQAGRVGGTVSAIAADGIAVTFALDARSVAFALAAIAAGMTRRAL